MLIYTMKFNRSKAAFAVMIAALIIIALILLMGAHDRKGTDVPSSRSSAGIKTEKARVNYLKSCGLTVDSPAAGTKTILIPREFNPVFENYNRLQKQQGFDLSRFCGSEAEQYSYRVAAPAEYADMYATLYILNGEIIGGDVHSTALDGFIGPLRQTVSAN